MNNILTVYLNGQSELEYDRDKELPERQQQYLEGVDKSIDEKGIRLGEDQVKVAFSYPDKDDPVIH